MNKKKSVCFLHRGMRKLQYCSRKAHRILSKNICRGAAEWGGEQRSKAQNDFSHGNKLVKVSTCPLLCPISQPRESYAMIQNTLTSLEGILRCLIWPTSLPSNITCLNKHSGYIWTDIRECCLTQKEYRNNHNRL